MAQTSESSQFRVPQWFLNIGIILTLLAFAIMGLKIVHMYESLYEGLGSKLPLLTRFVFLPGTILLWGILIAIISLVINLIFYTKKSILISLLSVLLTISACSICIFVYSLYLPIFQIDKVFDIENP